MTKGVYFLKFKFKYVERVQVYELVLKTFL